MSDFLPFGVSKFIGGADESASSDMKGSATGQAAPQSFSNKVVKSLATTGGAIHVLAQGQSQGTHVYFPQELTGGVCKNVAGQEEYVVWRAAAAACGSERVHVVWEVVQDKIFYLAIKSEEMASHSESWCPFTALLPGKKDAMSSPVCYTYYANGSAAMMVITADTLEVYRGIGLIARAKAERSARELNNAPIIELTSDRIAQLQPTPWHSISLFEDQARRLLMMIMTGLGLAVASLAFVVWLCASFMILTSHVRSARIEMSQDTRAKDVSKEYYDLRNNPMHQQLTDFVKVNDELLAIDGLLTTYQISKANTYWRAVVGSSISAESMNNMNAVRLQTLPADKILIGHGSELSTSAQGGVP